MRLTKKLGFALALLALAATLGCSKSANPAPDASVTTDAPASNTPSGSCDDFQATEETSFAEPFPMCIDTSETYTATVATSEGAITFDMTPSTAPNAVNNFVSLASIGFYDGLTFHRVIDGFMIQGGDPDGTGMGGPGYAVPDELSGSEKYPVGTVAMANSGPDTNGSQFFIVTGPDAASLPPAYVVIGRVTQGQEVAEAISMVPRDAMDKPTTPVVMDAVTIREA